MKMKKFIALAAVAVLGASMMMGCGGSNSGSDTGSNAASGDWDAANDITIVSREDGSGTRGAFIELFGVEEKDANGEKVDNTTADAQITNSTSVMMTTVAGDDYAIGYVSLGSLDDSVKAVKIDGAEATAENVKSGTYKVSRPFNIVTTDKLSEVGKDFMNYILSTEGQKVVTDNKYIALDDTKAFKGTSPAGKLVVGGSSSVSPVMEKLIEAYKAVNAKADIELQTTDSTTGVTSTVDGSYDIGMASRELKDEETSQGVTATVIATDGIAVVVNNNSTIDELTSDQVKAIYTGETITWDEVAK